MHRNRLPCSTPYIYPHFPQPLQGKISVDWRCKPCKTVGGDGLDYDWFDSNHFFFYLFDVAGNGSKAALHSDAIRHVIQQLAKKKDSILLHPKELLKKLNKKFPMQKNDHAFFSIWYGVYNIKTNTLTFASAGHPPAVVVPTYILLQTKGPAIGTQKSPHFEEAHITFSQGESLYLFSDGVSEFCKKNGEMETFTEFLELLKKAARSKYSVLDRIISLCQEATGEKRFSDDFSLLVVSTLR